MKVKDDFIKIFLALVLYLKGVGIFWTCVEDDIIKEREE